MRRAARSAPWLLTVLAGCAGTAHRDAEVTALIAATFTPVATEHEVPGMVVGVLHDGRSTFWCHGLADPTTGVPVTPDTLFEIGSISKVFAATLAAAAEARGVLSLDDPAVRHVPELADTPLAAVRLVDLGTYTAGGLPLQFPAHVAPDGGLDWLRTWTPTAAPGTLRRYSNPSLGLFGHAVARAAGRDFATLLVADLLTPLGLRDSHVHVPADAAPRYAWGHDQDGRRVRVNPGPFADETYGLKASPADLLRFVAANLQPDTLPAPLAAAVRTTQRGCYRCGPFVQGLGWEQFALPMPADRLIAAQAAAGAADGCATEPLGEGPPAAATWFHKTGSTNGFAAYVAFVPQRRLGLVLLANRGLPIAARIAAAHAVLTSLGA